MITHIKIRWLLVVQHIYWMSEEWRTPYSPAEYDDKILHNICELWAAFFKKRWRCLEHQSRTICYFYIFKHNMFKFVCRTMGCMVGSQQPEGHSKLVSTALFLYDELCEDHSDSSPHGKQFWWKGWYDYSIILAFSELLLSQEMWEGGVFFCGTSKLAKRLVGIKVCIINDITYAQPSFKLVLCRFSLRTSK